MLNACIVEMSLQRLNALLSPLGFHRRRVFTVARALAASQDMPQSDLGGMRAARPFEQEQERKIVGKDNNLTDPAFLGEPISDFLAVQVVERGNWIVEHNA